MTTKGVNFKMRALDNTKPAFDSVKRGLRSVNQQAERTHDTMQSWNAGLNANRRAVQQLGFQMSDFAVQIAGGQSAMLAFTQQGGQMLQFFGPAGAIMAAFLAVFGSMALAFIKSGQSIETLYPALGVLRDEFSALGAVLSWVTQRLIDVAQIIVNHLDQILITASLVAGFFAARWIASMVAASSIVGTLGVALRAVVVSFTLMGARATLAMVATSGLTGALGLLRGAIMRLGFPALIIAAGYLIERFLALRAGAGGFANALGLLADLWRAVVDEMQTLALGLASYMKGVAQRIVASFLGGFADISQGFRDLVEQFTNNTFGIDIDLPDSSALGRFADEMDAAAENTFSNARVMMDSATKTKAALKAIRDAIAKGDTKIDLRKLMKKGPGEGDESGGGSDSGSDASEKLKDEADKIKEIFDDLRDTISKSMLSGFKSLLDGSKKFGAAARDILGSIADKVIDILMTPVFDGIAGMAAGGIMSGLKGLGAGFSFEGGGWTGNGIRAGGLDGKGGMLRMVHPQERVVDYHKAAGTIAAGGGGGDARTVRVVVEPVGGDLVLSDGGQIMSNVRIVARQEGDAATSRAVKHVKHGLRTESKDDWGLN